MQSVANKFLNISKQLIDLNQWVLWKLQLKDGVPKKDKYEREDYTKIPYQINGKKASSINPNTWTSYINVIEAYENSGDYDGVAFVLSENDNFIGIDLDECVSDGTIDPKAYTIVKSLNSYTEYSQSGKGIHIIVKGKKPGRRCKNSEEGVEIYEKNRFLIMTGEHVEGTPTSIQKRQKEIIKIYNYYFPNDQAVISKPILPSEEMSDQDILNKAFKASNGEKIQSLYMGDWSSYGSQSEADLALCSYLAFYTQDSMQIDRLFKSSGLYRNKWEREDYKSATIDKALRGLNTTYQKRNNNNQLKKQSNIDKKAIEKGSWWICEGSRATFKHEIMANYILQENNIARFPNEDGYIYIYNKKMGIYEIDKRCRQLRSIIRKLENLKSSQVREVQEYIVDMCSVFREESKDYIAVQNGLLRLNDMEFENFTPNVFVIKKIPTKYNPDAYDYFVENTLNKVSGGHKPTIRNICEMFGAVLYPNLLVPKMFYLYGRNAHNGKSTILNMIHKTFNDGNNISAISPQKLAENNFAASSIYGKLANIVDDLPEVAIKDIGTLKTIVTGGYIDIEYKGKNSRTVQMNTVCITASNHYPKFREHGNQVNKRLYIIPFDYNFMNDQECISESESMEKLSTESAREYVLKLAVEAVKEMIQRTGEVLTNNEKVVEAKQYFADYSNPLADFLFEYDKKFFEEVRGTTAFKEYNLWCVENNIQNPLGYKRFKKVVCTEYDMVWKDKKIKENGESITVKGFVSR